MDGWFFGIIVPAALFAAFFALYKKNRASLAPSVLFTCFLIYSVGAAALFLYQNENALARIVLGVLCFFFIFTFLFGAYALIAFLLLNARAVLKRETRSLANCLTLILAVAIIAYMIIMRIANPDELPNVFRAGLYWIESLVFCYSVHVTQYLTATALCNFSRPRPNQDFIIIHGAWLKNGEVTPLLAGRVDKAIQFYEKQKKSGEPPKLIMSGGQGSDEARSEAEAMAEYAKTKGVPESDILLEDKSINTLQNMLFSKQIMDAVSNGQQYKALYATSNYHVLRTGMYAQQAGLKIVGIGSKTALYYLPVALLREYIAYIVMRKNQNIAFAATCLIISCIITILATPLI